MRTLALLAGLSGELRRVAVPLAISVGVTAGLIAVEPVILPVTIKGVQLTALAAVSAYWVDRFLFSRARPHDQAAPELRAASWYRRALVLLAVAWIWAWLQ